MKSKFAGDFKLSITRALADQLTDNLAKLDVGELSTTNISTIENLPGIYELYTKNGSTFDRVYVGKASKSLPTRLDKHRKKLSGRQNVKLDEIYFKCMYVDEDLEASAPEKMLINRYRAEGTAPWNTNGFGNNDPGRNRDKSIVKFDHFDNIYPANLSFKVHPDLSNQRHTVRDALTAVKGELPYVLRFDSSSKDLSDSSLPALDYPITVEDFLEQTIDALPEGWHATALPGYVIIYKEQSPDYESARLIWSKNKGLTQKQEGKDRREE